ncbi:MAG: B12-binding domain-containing radical SAM protein [Promethearchaeota archaeon]
MKKPSILLIVPPVEARYTNLITNSPLLTSIRKYPALGLGYVAAMVEREGYPLRYLDMFALDMDYSNFKEYLADFHPDCVGITTDIASHVPAKKIAKIIKELYPECLVILGGVNIGLYYRAIMEYPHFDIGVINEGEHTILELLSIIENKGSFEKVRGIAFKKGGEIILTPERDIIQDLDSIPFPARHLMPNEKYVSNTSKSKKITTMITSRGCPFNCLYCIQPLPYRRRSIKNVVDEMEHIKNDLGIGEIMLVDSTFSVNIDHAIGICKEICRRKLDIIWEASTRVDRVSLKLLLWMKKAGCVRIQYGVESGDPGVLKILRKRINLKQVRDAVKWSKQAQLEILINYMIGCPGDTLETINKTIDLSIELDSDFAVFTITTVGPGTDMLPLAINQGLLKGDEFEKFITGELRDIPRVVFETQEYDRNALSKMLKKAYRKFYIRPKYVLKRLKKIRGISELKNHLVGLKNVLIEVISKRS